MSNNNGRRKLWFISDLHLGHHNSIKFDQRPFKDIDHMHRVIVNNWNAIIQEEDTVYVLGDVGMFSSEKTQKIIAELNGTKILIKGNHDKGVNAMMNLGFAAVLNYAAITIAGELVTMSHCPLRGVFREDVTGMRNAVAGDNWHGESKHVHLSVENNGQFHLHGHTHAGPKCSNGTPVDIGRQKDIGVCGHAYRPWSLSELESWIAKVHKEEKGR